VDLQENMEVEEEIAFLFLFYVVGTLHVGPSLHLFSFSFRLNYIYATFNNVKTYPS